MAGKIFINYRRGDDPGHTGRVFDRLQEVFQPEQLFMDVDNIEPGLDFMKVLKEQVAQCDVLIAVIGKGWVEARNETGGRRLDNPADFVRIEIESALAQDKRVIPVLVGEAQMPHADELPDAMKPLATRHAVRLTHERFRSDVQGLVTALQRALKSIEDGRAAELEAARLARLTEERRLAALEQALSLAVEEQRPRAVKADHPRVVETQAERKKSVVQQRKVKAQIGYDHGSAPASSRSRETLLALFYVYGPLAVLVMLAALAAGLMFH